MCLCLAWMKLVPHNKWAIPRQSLTLREHSIYNRMRVQQWVSFFCLWGDQEMASRFSLFRDWSVIREAQFMGWRGSLAKANSQVLFSLLSLAPVKDTFCTLVASLFHGGKHCWPHEVVKEPKTVPLVNHAFARATPAISSFSSFHGVWAAKPLFYRFEGKFVISPFSKKKKTFFLAGQRHGLPKAPFWDPDVELTESLENRNCRTPRCGPPKHSVNHVGIWCAGLLNAHPCKIQDMNSRNVVWLRWHSENQCMNAMYLFFFAGWSVPWVLPLTLEITPSKYPGKKDLIFRNDAWNS